MIFKAVRGALGLNKEKPNELLLSETLPSKELLTKETKKF